jgi:hypothetical protein
VATFHNPGGHIVLGRLHYATGTTHFELLGRKVAVTVTAVVENEEVSVEV